MKKIVSVFLILTYINLYLGCASNRIQKIQYNDIANSIPEKTSNDSDLYVFTNDSSRIIFMAKEYQFMGNLVDGSGSYFDYIPQSISREKKIEDPKHLRFPYSNIVLMTQGEQDLYLIKTDSTELFFGIGKYIFNRDSLIGKGHYIYRDYRRGKLSYGTPYNMKIALVDIAGISTGLNDTNFDKSGTKHPVSAVIVVGVIIAVTYFVIYIWSYLLK